MIVVVMVMLAGMLAVKLSVTLVTTVDPVVVLAMAGYPYPLISAVPIGGTFVIRPIANVDSKVERSCAWANKQTRGEQTAQNEQNFLFHITIVSRGDDLADGINSQKSTLHQR